MMISRGPVGARRLYGQPGAHSNRGLKVTFEIEANEKSGKFRVHYTLLFDEAEDRCVGFLRHPDGKLMGTFTGMRSSK